MSKLDEFVNEMQRAGLNRTVGSNEVRLYRRMRDGYKWELPRTEETFTSVPLFLAFMETEDVAAGLLCREPRLTADEWLEQGSDVREAARRLAAMRKPRSDDEPETPPAGPL